MTANPEVQTPGNASPPAATPSPGSDTLGDLLKEFEDGTANANGNHQIAKVLRAFQPVVEHVAQEAQTKAEAAEQADVKEAVSFVMKEAAVPDKKNAEKAIRGYLRDIVADEPAAAKAWSERKVSPDAWKAYLSKASVEVKELVKELAGPDVRTDIERARASVRNVETQPSNSGMPSPIEMQQMSDRDWKNFTDKQLAAQPR